MNNSEFLFRYLQALKQDDGSGKSSQIRLLEYCSQTLGAIERLHFDFKEKTDRRNAKLSDDDKKNLAKAVSGFGNSGGGVLIWGIENGSMTPKPISNIQEFVATLLSFAPQTTDPIVRDIDGDWIQSDTASPNDGFGIIFIPESSLPPHRVVLKNSSAKDHHKNHYYVRSGEDFVVASHIQLEDMFGRRPHPNLELFAKPPISYGDDVGIVVSIRNVGRGIAKFPYLAIEVEKPCCIAPYGLNGNGGRGLPLLVQLSYTGLTQKYGGSSSIVIHPEDELDVDLILFKEISATNRGRVLPDIVIKYSLCCESMQMRKGEMRIPSVSL